MRYQKLGNSGLLVSELGLGTMLFGDSSSRGTSKEDAIRMLDMYLDHGGNHVDTANVYGDSELILGEALREKQRDRIVLASKVRFPPGGNTDPNGRGLSRKHILDAVENSLKLLQTDYLDLYYFHMWDPLTPIAESIRAMEDLIRDGKVRYWGVSNFKAWHIMKAAGVADQLGANRCIAAQYQYSLIKRDIEYEYADLCLQEGLGLVPWGALGQGFLTGKYKPEEAPTEGRIGGADDSWEETWARRNTARNWETLRVVFEVAEAHEVPPSQVALAWLCHQPWVGSALIGARTLKQFEDNLQAKDVVLTSEEVQRLTDASTLPEMYPYRMMQEYSNREEQRR